MKKPLLYIIGFGIILVIIASTIVYKEVEKHNGIISVYGNVDVRQVDLGFRVFGRVTELRYEEGDWVKKGDLVALMEKKPYTDQVVEAKANIASIEASLANEERMLKRRTELIDSKSVSQEDLETVYANYRVLQANLEQAQASLAIAEKNLVDTEVYAPTEGTILTRIREPGSVVQPGEAVYTLSIASPVWIRAFINERELGLVYPGMSAEIHTDTPGGRVYTGTVGFISPVSEFTPKTVETTQLRTDLVYRIRVYADNPDLGLRQGMPVTVKMKSGSLPQPPAEAMVAKSDESTSEELPKKAAPEVAQDSKLRPAAENQKGKGVCKTRDSSMRSAGGKNGANLDELRSVNYE
jgi:HlyD family secretion protein